MKKITLSAIFLISFCIATFPQSKQESIKELIRIMQQDSLIDKTFRSTIPAMMNQMKSVLKDSASQAQFKKTTDKSFAMIKEITKKMINEDMVALYDKYFTEKELKDFIAFYKTTSGQKMLKVQPDMQIDLTKIMFQKYMPSIMDSIKSQSTQLKPNLSKTEVYVIDTLPVNKDSVETTSNDMEKYLNDTRRMVEQKRYKIALERFIWFYEHALEHQPSMSGVRNSYALSDWMKLREVYPPALTSLRAIRDRRTKQIMENNSSSVKLFSDVRAINRELGENEKTIELFEKLTNSNPEVAKDVWVYAKDALFNAKRYDIIRNYIGNPVREFTSLIEDYNRDTAKYHNKNFADAHFKAFTENRFVEQSIKLIDFAVAVNDLKSAEEIQQKALAILDDYRLRNAIKEPKKK